MLGVLDGVSQPIYFLAHDNGTLIPMHINFQPLSSIQSSAVPTSSSQPQVAHF